MDLKNKSAEFVRPAAEKAALEFGCRVIELAFRKEKDGPVLRVVIDGDAVSLDTCASVSEKFSRWLDAHEKDIPFEGYVLEVSSPGPDKPLETREDFEAAVGKRVLVTTKSKAEDGRRRYSGVLESVSDSDVTIYVEKESAKFNLKLDDIRKARLEYEL